MLIDDDFPLQSFHKKSKKSTKNKKKNADPFLVEVDSDEDDSDDEERPSFLVSASSSSSSTSEQKKQKMKKNDLKKKRRESKRFVDPFLMEVSESDEQSASDDEVDTFVSKSLLKSHRSASPYSSSSSSAKPAQSNSLAKSLSKKNPSKAKDHKRKAHEDPFLMEVDSSDSSSSEGQLVDQRSGNSSGGSDIGSGGSDIDRGSGEKLQVVDIDEFSDSSENESEYEEFTRMLANRQQHGAGTRGTDPVLFLKSLRHPTGSSDSGSSEESSESLKSHRSKSSSSQKLKRKRTSNVTRLDGESDSDAVAPSTTRKSSSAVEKRSIQLQTARKRTARNAFLSAFDANDDTTSDNSDVDTDASTDDASESAHTSRKKPRISVAQPPSKNPFDSLPVRKPGEKRAKVKVQVFDEVAPEDEDDETLMPFAEPIVASRDRSPKKSSKNKHNASSSKHSSKSPSKRPRKNARKMRRKRRWMRYVTVTTPCLMMIKALANTEGSQRSSKRTGSSLRSLRLTALLGTASLSAMVGSVRPRRNLTNDVL